MGVNGTDPYGSAPHSHRKKEWWGQVGLLTVPLSTVYPHIPPPCPRLSWRSSGGYFTYRDQNIFYRDSRGALGSSNVVVLLHGFLISSYDWYKIDCTQRNHLKQFTKLWMSSRVILCCCSPKVTCGDADCTSVSLHRHILPWVQHCSSSGHLLLSNNRFPFSILQYINQRKKHREHWVGALMPTSVPLHLIYGPLDPVNPHSEFLQLYKRVLPMSTVSVLDDHISHYPQLEDPTGFLNASHFINSF
ncbi:LOW QUALITY PROTEIN: mesoderm-specific transcript homolog protein [Ara ararauna]